MIAEILLVKSHFMTYNVQMHQFLLYSTFLIAILALFIGFIACVRVGKFINSCKNLDWQQIAHLTGDVASLKRSIQLTNNRLNGMHSPKADQAEIMAQLLQAQQQPKPNGNMGG